MKNLICCLMLLSAGLAHGEQGFDVNSVDMKKMMAKMEQVQSCIQQIGQRKLKQLEQRTQQLQIEVKQLCADDKLAQAQARAVSFGKQLANDDQIISMKRCTEMMTGVLPSSLLQVFEDQLASQHVCG
ncbi:MAG: hypothetical protein JKY89_11820 [Immundisolibacteraceae bacterium]|nr:hypothetical protein [Immundisolibacteraceae bacterium]